MMAYRTDGYGRGAFAPWIWPLVFGLAAIALSLAPINLAAEIVPTPHWLLAVLMFWTARRPQSTPPLLVFLLGALHDLVTDGPIGAEIFALLVSVEALRSISRLRPHQHFVVEWLRIAACALLFELIVRAILGVTLTPAPLFGEIALRYASTVAAYPLIVLFLRGGFGLGRSDRKWISL